MEFFMPDRKPDYERNKPDPYPLLSESMRKVVDYQAAHAADAFDNNCAYPNCNERATENSVYCPYHKPYYLK